MKKKNSAPQQTGPSFEDVHVPVMRSSKRMRRFCALLDSPPSYARMPIQRPRKNKPQ